MMCLCDMTSSPLDPQAVYLRVRAQQQRIVARAAGRDQLNDAKPVAESSAQLAAADQVGDGMITNAGKA
jgi:hypothetical protein